MKQILIPILAVFFLYSCNNNNNNNVTPSVLYHGTLVYSRTTGTFQGSPFDNEFAFAEFYNTPMTLTQLTTGHRVFVDSVVVNGITMADNGDTQCVDGPLGYTVTTSIPIMWKVAGANGIPSFNFTHTGSFPDFTGNIPTTITKVNGLTMSFPAGSFSGADSAYVLINEYQPPTIIKGVALPGSISFSSQELNSLPLGTGSISYGVVNLTTSNFGGKNFFFGKDRRKTGLVNIN